MKKYKVSMTYEEYFHITVKAESHEEAEEAALEEVKEQESYHATSGEFTVYRIKEQGAHDEDAIYLP